MVSLEGYALIGLWALVGALVAVLVYAMLRFVSVARTSARGDRSAHGGSALMTHAVQEAVSRLRDQGREMQARAEASERLSDEVVGNMRSGLLLVDVDGRIRIVNPAAKRLLGSDVDVDDDYRTALSGVRALADALQLALGNAQPVVRRTSPSGATRPGFTHVSISVSPLTDPAGRLQSVICLFDDVTGLVALEEQLRLKDSLARLGELTAGIAHEFRNGLATIHGYARLIDPAQLQAPYPAYLAGIRAETDALGEIVSNFLNFARPAPLTLSMLDLRAVVQRAADDVRHDVERGGGGVDISGSFVEIEGDEVLLRQAFSNLCRNAAEACATAGCPARISVVGRLLADGSCAVAVSDSGPGIEPHLIGRIFQPFFTTRANGTGLGLALVQKIVVTHNGHVTASNLHEGGAVFDVVLPQRQASVH